MRLSRNILLLILICLISISGIFLTREVSPKTGVLKAPFKYRDGNCRVAELPQWKNSSDKLEDNYRSNLVLFEDGKPLGPPHQIHKDIEKMGQGRYSHWGKEVLFSSSDNTDPNTNGRTYSYELTPLTWRLTMDRAMLLLFMVLLSGCFLSPLALARFYRRTPAAKWFGAIGLFGLGLVLFLHLNILDPRTWYAVAVHVALIVLVLLGVLFAAFLVHKFRNRRSGPGFITGLVSGWGLVVAAALCLELFFRTIPIYSIRGLNPAVDYLWPDLAGYALNEYGFRDKMPQDPKPGHVFRILVVGDSFVEGVGLSRNELFGRVMEGRVNKSLEESGSKGRVEVVIWGWSGNNTQDNMRHIRNHSREVKPDLVILEYTLFNDAETHPITIKLTDTPWWVYKIHHLFLSEVKSYAYHWFFSNVTFFKVKLDYNLSGMELKPVWTRMLMQYRDGFKGWEQTKETLHDLSQWTGNQKMDRLVLVFPIVRKIHDYPDCFKDLHLKLDRVLMENGLDRIDLRDLLAKTGLNGPELVLSRYDGHPNALANRIVGEYLAEWLTQRPSFQDWLRKVD